MNHYLIMASDLPALEGRPMKAQDVFNLMRDHSCWEFPESSQQAKLKEGDQLFFYLGSKVKHIVAEATVAGLATPITMESPITFDRNIFPYFVWRRPLRNFQVYEGAGADLDMMMNLSFASKTTVTRPYIGLLLRVGMRTLTEEDAKMIRAHAAVSLAK